MEELDEITAGIIKIRALNKFSKDDLLELISMATYEENDVVRACARATIEGNAIAIIKELLWKIVDE